MRHHWRIGTPSAVDRLRSSARVHRGIDEAVRWRLGASRYDTEVLPAAAVPAPEHFWAATRVTSPAPLTVTGEWRHRDSRELRLEGPSDGPGDHPGADTLIATAHVVDGAPADAPMILMVHGYAVPIPFWDALQARALRAAGAHTLLIDLPFHLRRRVRGHHSGDGFFSADPARILATVRQAVEDAAALVAWARAEVTPRVGVLGVSLGGLVGSLVAAEVEMDGATLVAPLCDAPSTFLNFLPRNAQRRLGIGDGGGGRWGDDRTGARALLDRSLAPIVPRHLRPRTDHSLVTLVRPIHDVIVGPEPVAELARAWGAELWDYPRGHITVMSAPGIGGRLRQRVLEAARHGVLDDGRLSSGQ